MTIPRPEYKIMNEIMSCIKVFESVIPVDRKHKSVYASSPTTTGLRLYETFKKYGVINLVELNNVDRNIFRNEVLIPNLKEGRKFGKELREFGFAHVIVPGELDSPGKFKITNWGQMHYITLWKNVITKHADMLCLNDNYYYSNGCVEELLHALSMGMGVQHRRDFSPIQPGKEIRKISDAIDHINNLNINSDKLESLRDKLKLFHKGSNR
jgi:hypothetical protein